MSNRPDPEFLDDLTEAERRELLDGLAPHQADQLRGLGAAFSALDEEAWREAEVPRLRFEPEGAGQPTPFLYRGCVREDGYGGRIPAPLAFAGIAVAVVLALVVGVVLGGATGEEETGPQSAVERRLASAPPVSLVRAGTAPVDASGVVRMAPGRDGGMVLRAHGLRPTDDGWYEVWMVRDRRHVVSVGTFRAKADGTVDARFDVPANAERYPRMDVSLQTPADGGAHSGRSVLRSLTTVGAAPAR